MGEKYIQIVPEPGAIEGVLISDLPPDEQAAASFGRSLKISFRRWTRHPNKPKTSDDLFSSPIPDPDGSLETTRNKFEVKRQYPCGCVITLHPKTLEEIQVSLCSDEDNCLYPNR